MIATDSITKLSTTVVYVTSQGPVLGEPGLLLGADLANLRQFIEAPEARQLPDGLAVASMRNQFIVTIRANRLEFEDHSGDEPVREDFPNRVASVAEYIGHRSSQTYAAIGLNFDIESKPANDELPSRAVLRRLIKEDVLTGTGYSPLGASTRLWYTARNGRYELRIEPRGNQFDSRDYFAHLNAHVVLESELPSAQWLSQALYEEYSEFKKVLTELLN